MTVLDFAQQKRAGPVARFRDAMQAAAIPVAIEDIIADGKLHRLHVDGDSAGSRNVWYVLFLDERPAGMFGCWKRGIKETWYDGNRAPLSEADRAKFHVQIEEERRHREQLEEKRHKAAAVSAAELWERCAPAANSHAYLKRKCITAHGARQDDTGRLVLPLADVHGKIWSVETVAGGGAKRFMPGGRKKGGMYLIGAPGDRMVVAEGFATGASIHMATGIPVAVAFDAGNLEPVACAIRERWPGTRIVIAADNDRLTTGNPGVRHATQAAEASGGTVAVADFLQSTEACANADFNDIARAEGPETVAAIITAAFLEPAPEPPPAPSSGPDPKANGEDTGHAGEERFDGAPPDDPPALPFQIADWNAATRFTGPAPPQKWLFGGVIPCGVAGLIAGAGDAGKSFLLLHAAIRITQGPIGTIEPLIFGGIAHTYGPVVFITAEDGEQSVHRRMRALDPDGRLAATRKHPLYVVTLPDAGGPFPIVAEERGRIVVTPQFEALRQQLKTFPNLALVVLDPLQCFVHADINADPRAAAITMSLLNMLAAETGATVLASHHVRKEKEAPKTAQEARLLIRGSSALVDQSRIAVVMWQPNEPDVRKLCREAGAEFAPNAIVHGCVVKANDGANRKPWTLLRDPASGVLTDVTGTLNVNRVSSEAMQAKLVAAIAAAAANGQPYTKSGVNGLFDRRAELGDELNTAKRAQLVELAQELERQGQIVVALATGTTVKWLDVPGGQFARGEGEFAPGVNGRGGRKAGPK